MPLCAAKNFPPTHIKYLQINLPRCLDLIANGCFGIEGIGIILLELERGGDQHLPINDWC